MCIWNCQRNLNFYYWRTARLYTQSAKPRGSGYSITHNVRKLHFLCFLERAFSREWRWWLGRVLPIVSSILFLIFSAPLTSSTSRKCRKVWTLLSPLCKWWGWVSDRTIFAGGSLTSLMIWCGGSQIRSSADTDTLIGKVQHWEWRPLFLPSNPNILLRDLFQWWVGSEFNTVGPALAWSFWSFKAYPQHKTIFTTYLRNHNDWRLYGLEIKACLWILVLTVLVVLVLYKPCSRYPMVFGDAHGMTMYPTRVLDWTARPSRWSFCQRDQTYRHLL
jgi:hypothetical protein